MHIKSWSVLYSINFVIWFIVWVFSSFLWFFELLKVRNILEGVIIISMYLVLTYGTYHCFRLFKIYNYKLIMGEKDLTYTFLFSKRRSYSDISKIFWITKKLRWKGAIYMLKIRFNDGSSIIISPDKLKKEQSDYLVCNLRAKTKKGFVNKDLKWLSDY